MKTTLGCGLLGLLLLVGASAGRVRAQPIFAARVNHAQVVLPDGRIMLVGGEHIDALFEWGAGTGRALDRQSWIYDPRTSAWSRSGDLSRTRTNHSAIAIAGGKVVVLGGGASSLTPEPSVEEWDPASRRWRRVGRLARARFGHTATLLADGRILVAGGTRDEVGGSTAGANVLDSVEIWDPASQRAVPAAPLPIALTRHAAVRLRDGRVLVTGGTRWWGGAVPADEPTSRRAFVWDPALDRWTEVSAMSGARSSHASTLLQDGRVLVVGNRVDHAQTSCSWIDPTPNCQNEPVRGDVAEIFDPRTGRFTLTSATRFPRIRDVQTAVLRDGRVAIFGVGGFDCVDAPQVVEVWSPATGQWSDFGDAAVTEQGGFRLSALGDGRLLITGADMRENRRGLMRAHSAFAVWDPGAVAARVPPRESDIARTVAE